MFMPLKKENLEKIHSLSLRVLDKVGIEIGSEKALKILKDAGARVALEKKRAYIPPPVVEKALKNVPSSFTIYGRQKGKKLQFKRGENILFGGSGVPSLIYDAKTGLRQNAKLKDFISIIKLFNGLPNVDLVTDSCTFTDIPAVDRDMVALFHMTVNTQKPFLLHITFTDEENFSRLITMTSFLKESVFAGKQFVIFRISPLISPLKLDEVQLNHLINTAAADIPLCPVSMPQAGMSSPASLAGTVVVMNAEILTLLVISQVVRPGVAFLYAPVPEITNFMTGNILLASPEVLLLNIAANQLAEYYNLPNWATACRTDSKILDIQAGYESSFGVLLMAICGATYVSAISGLLESAFSFSLEKAVIDDEIVGMTKRVLKGIATTPEHYAFELIASVGPGGNFLFEQHTVEYMRKEFFYPEVSELSSWSGWEKKGKSTALKKAREKAEKIIASHSISPLPDDVIKQIRDTFPNVVKDNG